MSGLSRRSLIAAGLAAPAVLATRAARAAPDTLAIGVISDPVTLDPAFAGSFFENQVFYNLYETLLVARPNGDVAPGLVQRWTMRDPLTYAFTLRPGLTYQDGTVLDAASVKANIDRYLDPATGSIRRADYGPTREVVVTGALDFELHLASPYAPLPLVLTNRAGMMVSMAALKRLGPDFAAHGVGAGPWKLSRWVKNSELVLEAFDGYWQGAKQPFRTLSYRPIADGTARLENLRSGTLQLIDAVPAQNVAELSRDSAVRVSHMPSLGFNAWSLNCTRAPFDDVRLRQAFVAATAPAVMERVVYFGTGQVSHGPLSPAVPWAFDPGFTGIPPDPAHARALLSQAGVTGKLPVTVTVTNAPDQVRIAQIVQAQAAQSGFAVTIRQTDATSLLSVLQKRDFEVCMSPWSGRYDPDGNMFFYFTANGPNNFPGWRNDAVTAQLVAARGESDRAKRAALYRAAQTTIGQEAPMLFLHFDAVLQASDARLHWTQYPDAVFRLFDASYA